MGYGANHAWVVPEGTLKRLCLRPLRDLHKMLKDNNISFDQFCEANQQDDYQMILIDPQAQDELIACYDDLQQAFKKKTGLHIQTEYHNGDDNGSCYDDVNGGFWIIPDGMTALTKEGKRLQRQGVRMNHWCTYG